MKWYLKGAAGAVLLLAACTETDRVSAPSMKGGPQTPSFAFAGAGYTSTNSNVDTDNPLCLNGNPLNPVNCNIYPKKEFVWLNGGPEGANLPDGTYFFAVVAPSGQGGNDNPNDGTPKNLSDGANGDYTTRTFTVSAGVVSYPKPPGTHAFDSQKIRLMPYDDTPNPGGVYILAICEYDPANVSTTYPPGVDPSNCKYDAFKIHVGECVEGCGGNSDATLEIDKTLTTSFKRKWSWSIDKSSTVTEISLPPGGSTSVPYSVKVDTTGSTDSNWGFSGTVKVTNTGLVAATNVTIADPKATLTCVPTLPVATLAIGGEINCTYSETAASGADVDNTATVSWDKDGGGSLSAEDKATGSFTTPTTLADNCVDVKDSKAPDPPLPATVCITDKLAKTFAYSVTVTAPSGTGNCGGTFDVDNKATATPNTTGAAGEISDTWHILGHFVCGCTLGYWKNNDIYDWKIVVKPSTYGFAALAGGANGGTGDWYWKNTNALAPGYSWPNGAPNVYRTASSKLNQPQAFNTTALGTGTGTYASLATLGFYQALSLPGGTTFLGKAQNLMRQATAGLLNATWSAGGKTIGYPLSATDLVSQVNAALATQNATTIDNLQKVIAGYNQAGTQDLGNNNACPINAAGVWWPH